MAQARYLDSMHMNAAQAQAFPGVDFVIAVRLPRDANGDPAESGPTELSVHAADHLTLAPDVNLAGKGEIATADAPVQLLPRENELLRTIFPDNSAAVCVNRPVWKWFGLTLSDLGS